MKKKGHEIDDTEETRIQGLIANDADAPEATDEQLAQARPFTDAFPELSASIKRARGRPRKESPKEAVTLRLSPETLERYKAQGDDWRTRMSEVLEATKPRS